MKFIRSLLTLSPEGEKEIKKAIFRTVVLQIVTTASFAVGFGLVFALLSLGNKKGNGYGIAYVLIALVIGGLFAMIEALARRKQYDSTNIPSYRECERIRLEVAEKLERLPYSFFAKRQLSEVTSALVDDCVYAERLISNLIPVSFASCITLPLAFLCMFFVDLRMGVASVFTVLLGTLLQFISLKYQEILVLRQLDIKHEAEEEIHEYVTGMVQIRSDSRCGSENRKLQRALTDLKKASLKMELTSGVFTSAAEVLLQMGIGLVVLVGSLLLREDPAVMGSLILFFAFTLRIYIPAAELITTLPSLIYERHASNNRIREILEAEVLTGDSEPTLSSHDLELFHVGFGYGDKQVLRDVSFTAKAGEVTALVGETGSGKTTVANLIARFWDPDEGRIMLDGHDIRDIRPEFYDRQITCVFQDVLLFHDTVCNNILIGNPKATKEEVYRAAELACCTEFIERLPEGFDTVLTENGGSLSGGERQRLSIARAILKNAPIVILDEATASLDTQNEYRIHQAISNLCAGKTVLVIAHTLRNIKNANRIVVLDHGSVIESGTHKELMERGGKYAHLYEMQMRSLDWEMGRAV